MITLSLFPMSCAHYPSSRYNTQAGAVIGAGTGALIGQAIGGNTEGTLIGLAAGTILGALVGNAVDQDYQAARDAAMYRRPVIISTAWETISTEPRMQRNSVRPNSGKSHWHSDRK